mgnify:CR=1 FL=1
MPSHTAVMPLVFKCSPRKFLLREEIVFNGVCVSCTVSLFFSCLSSGSTLINRSVINEVHLASGLRFFKNSCVRIRREASSVGTAGPQHGVLTLCVLFDDNESLGSAVLKAF